MLPDQDWQAVWPSIRTFHPAVVPLPVRQGFIHLKSMVHPHKKANVELMKIPNFLHLTPPAITSQCKAIKKFCTSWPKGDVETEFPTTEITSTYLNASSSIRDHRARVVSLVIPLDSLKLDAKSKEKIIRLARERYDPVEDAITIVTDSCPYKKQNQDYAEYLLTAIYFESQKVEEWEKTKTEKDLMSFSWPLLKEDRESTQQHINSLQTLLDEGENPKNLESYRNAVEKVIGIESSQ